MCELDWDWRYDLMKQHTGQHVLSAVIEQLFGSSTNISRGDEFVNQIDLEHALSPGQLVQAQTGVQPHFAGGACGQRLFGDAAGA